MTAQEIINRALRLIGALPTGQTPSAAETADALSALNNMLTRWEANGLRMGFSTVTAGSTMPVPDETLEAIGYNLAVRIAPEYGVSIPGEIAVMAEEGLRALQRDAIPTPVLDTGLPKNLRWNINSGSYW